MDEEFSEQQIDEAFLNSRQMHSQLGYQSFQRKCVPELPTDTDLNVMQIDISSYSFNNKSVLRMYAITEDGLSVMVHVHGFCSYFYVECPSNFTETRENFVMLMAQLNEVGSKRKNIGCADGIRKVGIYQGENIREYKGRNVPQTLKRFLKITTKSPLLVNRFRKVFEDGFVIEDVRFNDRTFESNIPFVLRFMVDKDIPGMSWVKIAGGKFTHRKQKISHCQIEIECDHTAMQPLTGPQWDKIAPLRIFSFDIECNPKQGFPNEQHDEIITIACVCKTSTERSEKRVVLSLKECAPIAEVHVESFKKEADMLLKFEQLLISYDPDFIIGYNIINFDLKYILGRAQALNIRTYGYFGRTITTQSRITNGRYLSKAMGMRDTKEINIEGRIQLDMMMHMHRQHKLSSYSLNSVSMLYLQQRKEDVHYSELSKLHDESNESRRRIAIYCLKDAELPLKLMDKLMCLYNYTEMARVTGVPLNFLFTRGQQIKVVSQIMRRAKHDHYLLPTDKVKRSDDDEVAFEGAFVVEPKSGFYRSPIATLDFASLYPSIMMAHNLCYTTLVRKSNVQLMGLEKDKDYVETEDGYCFVKSHIKKGILPAILEDLISARKRAKLELAKATDEMTKGVLEGRQLALKISANSVYGFTGAVVGQLPCIEISSSVTSFGRQMIKHTREEVLKNFEGADVIYGDTDSVMVKFKVDQSLPKAEMIAQAMKLGKQAADMISSQFQKPIKLQFEKVYCPYLLVTKKRYAGLLYTKPNQPDKLDKKGIESVRRDNCVLIRTMLEEVLRIVMQEESLEKCAAYIKHCVSELLQNKIDIGDLVITKALTKKSDEEDEKKGGKNTYKAKQAHVILAEKMRKRQDNSQNLNIGDRIPYVMISGVKGSKNFENAEDPRKVLMEDIPIDFDYYIEKQIKPPLQRLLKDTNIITNFDALFTGDHTKNRYIPKSNNSTSLGKFIVTKTRCLGCRVVSDKPICDSCEQPTKVIDIYLSQREREKELEQKYALHWKECQSCMGNDLLNIICENMDCKIFYKRIKIQKDLEEQRNIMKRFQQYE